METEEIAWAAGFFDGEGSIFVTVRNGYWFPRIRVGQNMRLPLEKLKNMFGGHLENPHVQGKQKHLHSRLVLDYNKARAALRIMLPFLIVKREMALALLDCSTQEALKGFRDQWQKARNS